VGFIELCVNQRTGRARSVQQLAMASTAERVGDRVPVKAGLHAVRFEVSAAVAMKNAVFCDVASCGYC
jgi:hypothetical protein